MATPKKLPSGNWRVQVFSHKENGKNKYISFTAATKAEANRLAAEFQANKEHEDRPQDITIEKAYENYLRSKSNILAADTYKEYLGYKKYYQPIANIRIGSLTTVDLQNFVNQLSSDKKPKTVKNIYRPLASAISMYSDRNYKITMPQKSVIERHIPTDNDVANLLSNANHTLKLAIILGSKGMRRGEICSLKYKDIMRDFNAIYIHSDMILGKDGWVYKEVPKTSKSVRRIILTKDIIDMLGNGETEDYILKVKPSTITADFIHLRNKLGLQCRFHDLRHYSVSILHALGLPDAFIMEHHGYSSDGVMKSVYRHTLSDKSAQYAAIANEYFEKNIISHEG